MFAIKRVPQSLKASRCGLIRSLSTQTAKNEDATHDFNINFKVNVPKKQEVLNYAKYPWLKNLKSKEAQDAIQQARLSLQQNGVVFFPNFITKETIDGCIKECDLHANDPNKLFICDDLHNVYYLPQDNNYPSYHIRNQLEHTKVSVIPADITTPNNPIMQIYKTDELKSLVQAVMNKPVIYRSADPLVQLSVNVLREGWLDGWHFDESEFSTTLMLQGAEAGGKFELCTIPRENRDDFSFEVVEQAVHEGVNVKQYSATPGTLAVFGGRRILHRVSPVEGKRNRYVCVFTFSTEKNFVNSSEVQEFFVGRKNLTPNNID